MYTNTFSRHTVINLAIKVTKMAIHHLVGSAKLVTGTNPSFSDVGWNRTEIHFQTAHSLEELNERQ